LSLIIVQNEYREYLERISQSAKRIAFNDISALHFVLLPVYCLARSWSRKNGD